MKRNSEIMSFSKNDELLKYVNDELNNLYSKKIKRFLIENKLLVKYYTEEVVQSKKN